MPTLQDSARIFDEAVQHWHKLMKPGNEASFHRDYEAAHGWIAMVRALDSPIAQRGCLKLACIYRERARAGRGRTFETT